MAAYKSNGRLRAEEFYKQSQAATNRASQQAYGGGGFLDQFHWRNLFNVQDPQAQLEYERAAENETYALAQQRAQEQQGIARDEQARALSDVMVARGMDPRAIPGIGGALGGSQGAEVVNSLYANPNVSPDAAQAQQMDQAAAQQQAMAAQMKMLKDQASMGNQQARMQLAQVEAQNKQQELLRVRQEKGAALYAPVQEYGRSLGNIADLRTLSAEEGMIRAPGAARGAYDVLRGQLINDVRKQIEAGALQKGDLEFIETMLPDRETWFGMAQDERQAKLNELEYQFSGQANDYLQRSGIQGDISQFSRPGRSLDDIVGKPLPQGFEELTPPTQGPDPDSGVFGEFMRQMGM